MDIYVIHCQKHIERLANIDHHLKKLFPQLKLWDGTVIDKNVSFLQKEMQKYDNKITVKNENIFKTLGEIGCYLSHHTLLKHIKETKSLAKYTLILEDDGMLSNNTVNIEHILDKVEFDILYLGLNNENKNKKITETIYSIDNTKPLQGTHAYVVNNSKINKIYESTLTPIGPIDYQYEISIKNNTINAVIIFPYLCIQDRKSFHSTIKPSFNSIRNRRTKRRVIETPSLMYNSQHESNQRILKDNTRINNLINVPKPIVITYTQNIKKEGIKRGIRKRVKNTLLPKNEF
jgi:GR25 family glycosyltransferase involved in LPS biosynthesis